MMELPALDHVLDVADICRGLLAAVGYGVFLGFLLNMAGVCLQAITGRR